MEHDFAELVTRLIFQLAIILAAAKVCGELCQRYLKLPSVLGELLAGVIIGPFALGGISFFGMKPLFSTISESVEHVHTIPISIELFSISQLAAVVLLFVAGLETDLKQFLRYASRASLVAVGGLSLPFAFGVGVTYIFKPGGISGDALLYSALFVGVILTATSVGITARILADLNKMDTPEGVTVMAAAVADDVLGILILAVVVGIADPEEHFSISKLSLIGIKAIGFWLILTGGGILTAKYISRAFLAFRVPGAPLALALGIAFLAAALAESFGLAMIIGAYSMGLALSGTTLAQQIETPIRNVYHAIVPIFFVVMGMLVDVTAIGSVLLFGTSVAILAILGKLAGSGVAALITGFNLRGSWRIGVGMVPRAEVAITIAGIGIAKGIIGAELFGVTIMVVIITTLIATILLEPAFEKGGSGQRSHHL